jgi:hypothetical protein
MFMFERDVQFTDMKTDNMVVTDKYPSLSGIRIHKLCIDVVCNSTRRDPLAIQSEIT